MGSGGARFLWGNDLTPKGGHQCNIWQGEFPDHDTIENGFHGTCPVRSFPANGYGIFEVVGNVCEWCQDWFTHDLQSRSGTDPQGLAQGKPTSFAAGLSSVTPATAIATASRSSNTAVSSSSNTGFRVVDRGTRHARSAPTPLK
jgi:sulfatase modifying factor 1